MRVLPLSLAGAGFALEHVSVGIEPALAEGFEIGQIFVGRIADHVAVGF
jgi:hypothetical protein